MGQRSRENIRTTEAPPNERRTFGTSLRGAFVPTPREAATILSVPTVLILFSFLFQPMFDAWRRFGYVRHSVARTAPAHRIAPDLFTEHALWWHELTRLTHALIHQPSNTHEHILGNVVLITVLAWTLLAVFTVIDRRSLFTFAYWELVVVSPVIGSFAFDLFGETAHGYGASTIGFAFLGTVAVATLILLFDMRFGWSTGHSARVAQLNNDWSTELVFTGMLLLFVISIIVSDLVAASPATPVHQAGVVFGALIGTFVVLFGDTIRVVTSA